MEDIIIIGAGPAGLTAAIYVERAGRHATVFEGSAPGGQIINSMEIENYPGLQNISGADYANSLLSQAKKLGAKIKFEQVTSIDIKNNKKVVKTAKNNYECKAIIIATGAASKKLGLDNEKELTGKGISYCATCDGAFFKNKVVAVVGGGNTAIEDALFLTNFCLKVFVIHRRDKFKADDILVQKLKRKTNVEFIMESNVTKIIGKDKLESIEVTKNFGEKSIIEVSALFVAIGQYPGNEIFSGILNQDSFGYIEADENCHTNIPRIYVAGDSRTKTVRQLITACADGAVAATSACNETSKT